MYPQLGKFLYPDSPDWVVKLTYQAEPPVFTKGALNPWEQERQRDIWTAEEQTWKEVQKEQATYRQISRDADSTLALFNHWVRDLESLTGKKSGMGAETIASFVVSSSGNPYLMAAMGVKMIVDIFMGKAKKKKIQEIMNRLTMLQGRLVAYYAQMEAIQRKVAGMIQVGEAIRDAQKVAVSQALQQSEAAYGVRQQLDRERGLAIQARNIQAAQLYPTRQGGANSL